MATKKPLKLSLATENTDLEDKVEIEEDPDHPEEVEIIDTAEQEELITVINIKELRNLSEMSQKIEALEQNQDALATELEEVRSLEMPNLVAETIDSTLDAALQNTVDASVDDAVQQAIDSDQLDNAVATSVSQFMDEDRYI